MNTTVTTTQKENLKNNAICISCLAFFPALYLIGSAIVALLG